MFFRKRNRRDEEMDRPVNERDPEYRPARTGERYQTAADSDRSYAAAEDDARRSRSATMVEGAPLHTHNDAAIADEEVATTQASPWEIASGWVRAIGLIIGVTILAIETALGFRLAFSMTAANPNNSFVDFIYDITGPLVSPFDGIISNRGVGDNGVFEPASVIAMVVYAIAALLVILLLNALASGPTVAGRRSIVTRSRRARSVRED